MHGYLTNKDFFEKPVPPSLLMLLLLCRFERSIHYIYMLRSLLSIPLALKQIKKEKLWLRKEYFLWIFLHVAHSKEISLEKKKSKNKKEFALWRETNKVVKTWKKLWPSTQSYVDIWAIYSIKHKSMLYTFIAILPPLNTIRGLTLDDYENLNNIRKCGVVNCGCLWTPQVFEYENPSSMRKCCCLPRTQVFPFFHSFNIVWLISNVSLESMIDIYILWLFSENHICSGPIFHLLSFFTSMNMCLSSSTFFSSFYLELHASCSFIKCLKGYNICNLLPSSYGIW